MKILLHLFTGAAVLATAVSAQSALVEVIPVSYTFDQTTGVGAYDYGDQTGRQLIDGDYGTVQWDADLGNGNAYEWVGWDYDKPVINIDFDLGTANTIDQIDVGSVQDNINNVVLPNVSIFSSGDGFTWNYVDGISIPESSANDNAYFTYNFTTLGTAAQYFRITLSQSSNGPWTFIDEVDFFTDRDSNSVPEPATMLLFGTGLAGIVGTTMRRKKK